MTAKRKITDKNGVQVFPITHTKAVLDDNGNSVEQRLQENLDLINQKQLEVGAVPSDITPTAGSTNWVTSGGVFDATSVYKELALSTTKVNIINVYNKWQTYFTGYYGIMMPIEQDKAYKIVAGDNSFLVAILKDNVTTNGETPNYSSAYPAKITVSANTAFSFATPDDANYIWFYRQVNSVTKVFSFSEAISLKDEINAVEEEYISTNAQTFDDLQKKQARENIGLGNGNIDDVPTVDSNNIVKSGGIALEINSFKLDVFGQEKNYVENKLLDNNGAMWNYTGGGVCTTHIPCSQGDVINYYAGAANAYLCVYNANDVKKEHLVSASFVKTLTVTSEDASYLLFSFFLNYKEDVYVTVNDTKYVVEEFHQGLLPQIDDVPTSGSNGLVKSDGIANAIKNNSIINAPSYYDLFEIGNITINASGWTYTTNNSRIRTKNGLTIPLKQGDIIGLTKWKLGQSMYIGWRRSDGTYGTNGEWKAASNYVVQEDGDYVICINNNSNSIELWSDFFFINSNHINNNIQKIDTAYGRGNHTYYGKYVDLSCMKRNLCIKNTFVEHYHTIDGELSDGYYTMWNQSMAIANNRIFLFSDATARSPQYAGADLIVMDYTTKEIIYKGISGSWDYTHHNNAQFINGVYYDAEDSFPLLLLSRGDYNSTNVRFYIIRITESYNENDGYSYVLTIIKTITIQGVAEAPFNASGIIDTLSGKFYMYSNVKTWTTVSGNSFVINQFDIKKLALDSQANVTLTVSDIENKMVFDYYVLQGGCAAGGRLFIGLQNFTTINGGFLPLYNGHSIGVINPSNGELETIIPSGTLENEGVAFYKGKLYVSSKNGSATAETTSPCFDIQEYIL